MKEEEKYKLKNERMIQRSPNKKVHGFESPGEIDLVWVFQVPLESSNQFIIHKVRVHAENVMISVLDLIISSYTDLGS